MPPNPCSQVVPTKIGVARKLNVGIIGARSAHWQVALKMTEESNKSNENLESGSTSRRPKLILHPGFAKSATTSLQRNFYLSDCALARALNVIWIGKGFKSYNGLPPVMEIGYQSDQVVQTIRQMPLDDDATYFLSAESVVDTKSVQEALEERFTVCRIILTIRFPLFLVLSDYAFRGWLVHPIESVLPTGHGQIVRQFERCRQKIISLEKTFSQEAILCPIELPGLESRFLQAAFGIAPDDLVAQMKVAPKMNASPSLAIAVVMHELLDQEVSSGMTREQRHKIMSVLQADAGPAYFRDFLPNCVIEYISDDTAMEESLRCYNELLAGSLSERGIYELNGIIRNQLSLMLKKYPIGPSEAKELKAHARRVLRRATASEC